MSGFPISDSPGLPKEVVRARQAQKDAITPESVRKAELEVEVKALRDELKENEGVIAVWRRRANDAESTLEEITELLKGVKWGPSTVDHQFPLLMRIKGLVDHDNGVSELLAKHLEKEPKP